MLAKDFNWLIFFNFMGDSRKYGITEQWNNGITIVEILQLFASSKAFI